MPCARRRGFSTLAELQPYGRVLKLEVSLPRLPAWTSEAVLGWQGQVAGVSCRGSALVVQYRMSFVLYALWAEQRGRWYMGWAKCHLAGVPEVYSRMSFVGRSGNNVSTAGVRASDSCTLCELRSTRGV